IAVITANQPFARRSWAYDGHTMTTENSQFREAGNSHATHARPAASTGNPCWLMRTNIVHRWLSYLVVGYTLSLFFFLPLTFQLLIAYSTAGLLDFVYQQYHRRRLLLGQGPRAAWHRDRLLAPPRRGFFWRLRYFSSLLFSWWSSITGWPGNAA